MIWAGYKELDESYVSIPLPCVFPSCAYLIHFSANTTCQDIAGISACHIPSRALICSASAACSCRRTSVGTPYTSIHPLPEPSNESTSLHPHLFLRLAHLPSLRRCAHSPPSTSKLGRETQWDPGLPLWSASVRMEGKLLVTVPQVSPS